jgi:16S rRNA (cytidine1402-2'-O)-methyltransferase
MSGTLYVVATPIGNLEDVSLRALRILREVDLIAAEDTRRTARLLQHYSISTPTTSLHEHNEYRKANAVISRLERGESVALVTDAGTPVVSDPGARVVSAAHRAGVRVEPIPGASAGLAALSASGFSGDSFTFAGFPPSRAAARRKWLGSFTCERRPLILFEAPHRIADTLRDLLDVFGDRPLAVGRELTKTHEELVVQPISSHLRAIQQPRGEYTLVLDQATEEGQPETVATDLSVIAKEFGRMTLNGDVSRRDAVRELARRYKVSTRELYAALHKER